MPRHYDYRCRACGHIELRYRNAQACRPCGSHEIERVRNEAPDTMLSAARTQIADLQRQLAEAQARAERAEATVAALRGVLRAIESETADSYDLFEQRVLQRVREALAAPDPGADLLDDARAQHAALDSLLARLDKDDKDVRYRMQLALGCPPVRTVEEAVAAYDAWVEHARQALAAGKRRGWDRPAEGQEESDG